MNATDSSTLSGLPMLLGASCWLVMLVIGALEAFTAWDKDARWRRLFWGYTALSFVVGAAYLLNLGLAQHLGTLVPLHGLPVLIAGRPPSTPSRSKLSRIGEFLLGALLLGVLSRAVDRLTTPDARSAASPAQTAATARTNGESTTGAPPDGTLPNVAGATAPPVGSAPPAASGDRIGIGYRVKDGAFESAISGLRVIAPAGFSLIGRDEWFSVGMTGPEVIVHDTDHSLQVFIDNVPASRPEGVLRLLRHIARSGSQLAAPSATAGESWALELLGETRTFETIVSPERIVRDAFFAFEGRAYVVSIQHAPNVQGVKEKAAAVLAGIRSLPAAARTTLRKQLEGAPDAQGLVSAQSCVRGRTFSSFEHGFGWTAPPGSWRFLTERALQLTGPNSVFGAVDDERGYRLLGGVIPMPNLDPRQVLERVTSEFETGAGPIASGSTPDGVRYLSRRGTVSRQGVAGHIHAAVLQHQGRTFILRLDGDPDTRDQSAKVFGEVVAGWRRKVAAIASEHAAGVYLDHRMGFTFREPSGWKVSANDADAEGVPNTDVVWTREGIGQIAISAAFHSGSQGAGDGLVDVVYAGVREALQASGQPALHESRETVAGRPARHLTFTQDDTRVDVYVLARSGVVFLLRSEGLTVTPSQLLRDNFELLP